MTSLNDRFGPSWTLSNCWAGGPVASKSRSDNKDDKYIRGFRGGQVGRQQHRHAAGDEIERIHRSRRADFLRGIFGRPR